MLKPLQNNKSVRKTRGGELLKEIFFIPPSNRIIIQVKRGKNKEIVLCEYTPTKAISRDRETIAKFLEYILFNLIYL